MASTPDTLANDQGDLWDSGKVASDRDNPGGIRRQAAGQSCALLLEGPRVGQGRPAVGMERAGVLDHGTVEGIRLGGAKWIAADVSATAATPHNGYHSGLVVFAPNAAKWVAVDLGRDSTIDAVRLYPAQPYDWPATPGFLFPVRFKIEVARQADFADAKTVVDRTASDVANPGAEAPIYRFAPISARHVRLTVTRLALRDEARFGFALAEMEVLAGQQNVAQGAAVTALDSIESGGWSKSRLVDGRVRG